MTRFIRLIIATVAVASVNLGCSTATYQVVEKGTYKVGVDLGDQPNAKILQQVNAAAPGGETAIVVTYFGGDKAPIVKAKGDSSSLVDATASVGRAAIDIAVKAAKASAGVP